MPAARRISRVLAPSPSRWRRSLCLAAAAAACERRDGRWPLGSASARSSSPSPQFTKAADGACSQATAPPSARELPVDGDSSSAVDARDGLDEVFDTLSRLPWRTFSFAVTPADSGSGVYRVRGQRAAGRSGATGQAGRGPVSQAGRTSPTAPSSLADETPQDLRRRYLMALHDPVVLQRPGLIVLADRWARGRAGGGAGRGGAGAAAARRPRHRRRGRPSSSRSTARSKTFATRWASTPPPSPRLLLASVAARRRRGLAHVRRRA